MEKLLEKYINYFETINNRMITPAELDKAKRDIARLSGGDMHKAELLVNQTIEKGWQKIYRLQEEQRPVSSNGLNTVYQNNDNNRDLDDELRVVLEKKRKILEQEVKSFNDFIKLKAKEQGIEINYKDNTSDAVRKRMQLKRSILKKYNV